MQVRHHPTFVSDDFGRVAVSPSFLCPGAPPAPVLVPPSFGGQRTCGALARHGLGVGTTCTSRGQYNACRSFRARNARHRAAFARVRARFGRARTVQADVGAKSANIGAPLVKFAPYWVEVVPVLGPRSTKMWFVKPTCRLSPTPIICWTSMAHIGSVLSYVGQASRNYLVLPRWARHQPVWKRVSLTNAAPIERLLKALFVKRVGEFSDVLDVRAE